MSRVVRSLAAIVVAAATCAGAVVHGQENRVAARHQRSLVEALAELQARGLKIIFSSEVVRADMRVEVEPRAIPLRRALDELLLPHGLIAQDGPGGRVLVVKNPRVRIESKPLTPQIPVVRSSPPPRTTDAIVEVPRFMETVDVTGSQPAEIGVGASAFAVQPMDVRSFAGGFDNVFRSLQALPGVVGTDELGSRIAVRGGAPDQNLTILDGVEIYNPYRLHVPSEDLGMSGIASAFNVDTLDSVELSAGAFDVRHGDRLSSLLSIRTRAGSSAEAIQGSAFASLTDANVTLEGQLPRRATGSWFVSARRTHLDLVADRVVAGGLPSFHDVNAKVSWQPRAGQHVSFLGSAGAERLRPGDRATADDEVHAATSRNYLFALTLEATMGNRWSTRTVASAYRLADSLSAFERSFSNSRGANTEASIATGGLVEFQLARDVEVRDLAVRQEFAFRPSERHALDLGVDAHWLDTRWAWTITGDRSQLQANGTSVRLGASLPSTLDSSRDSRRLGAWLQDRFQVTPRVAIQPGVRLDHSSLTGQTTLSPRLGAAWDVDSTLRLTAAFRLHAQSPGYEKLLQSDYFVDLGSRESARLTAERAIHAVAGLQRAFSRGLTARVDTYYRRFSDLIVGRLETEEERLARLAVSDIPMALIGSVPTRAEITSSPVNAGRGHAYGVEVQLAHDAGAASPLTASGSYAFGRANRTVYGVTHPFDYDRRHSTTMVANWKITPRMDLTATGRWASGFPRTAVRGVRVALEPDASDADGDGNRDERVPQRDSFGNPFYQPDRGDLLNLNAARLPHFARVDLRLTYRPTWSRERWAFYLDVVNVLNRKNVVLIDNALVFDPRSDRPGIIELAEDSGIPFFPSFGIRFWF